MPISEVRDSKGTAHGIEATVTQTWPPSSGLEPITVVTCRLCFVPPVYVGVGGRESGACSSHSSAGQGGFADPSPEVICWGSFGAVVWSRFGEQSCSDLNCCNGLRYQQHQEKDTCLLRNRQCNGLTKPNWNLLGKVMKADTCFHRALKNATWL